MSDGGNVEVRLSQSGGEEVVEKLKQISEGIDAIGSPAKIAAIGAAAAGLGAMSEIIEKAFDQVKEFAEGMGELAGELIHVREEEEQFEIRLTALNEKLMGFGAASEQAKENFEALVGMSSREKLPELVSVFQKITLMVGGTDESIKDLTQRMTLFGQASNVTAGQLLRVIQMAERTGTLPTRGELMNASLALQNVGISGEDIRTAAITGQLDELLQRLKLSKEMTDELKNSWANLIGDFQRSEESIKGVLGSAFDPLKEALKSLTDLLKDAEFRKAISELSGLVSTLFSAFGDLFKMGNGDGIGFFKWLKTAMEEQLVSWIQWANNIRIAAEALKGLLSGSTAGLAAADVAIQGIIAKENEQLGKVMGGHGASGSWGDDVTHPGTPPDLVKQIQAADAALQKLYDTADEKRELAGLTGLDKKLAEIALSAEKQKKALDDAFNALVKLNAHPDADSLASAKSTIDETAAINSEEAKLEVYKKYMAERTKEEERAAKERISVENSYQQLLSQLEKKSSDDIIEQTRATAQAQVDAMAAKVAKEKELLEKQFNDAKYTADNSGAAFEELRKKETALDVAFAQYRKTLMDEAAAKNKETLDLENNDWTAYYADLMKKSELAHVALFVAEQENGKKVAAEMVKNAQTAGDGFAAGLATVKAGLTSFGQDVAATMASLWSSLTTSFETGFYDILSGKFSSLKDVLASLWDSILKDFSKMLAQMLERWLITGDAMGNGQGGGGGLGAILSSLTGGSQAVYTPGGTANNGSGDWSVAGTQKTMNSYQTSGSITDTPGAGTYVAGAGALLGAGFMIGKAFSGMNDRTTSTPTYQGQSLGQTADFGGTGGGAFLAAAATVAAAAVVGASAIAATLTAIGVAATAAAVTVVGLVVAAALVIIGAILMLFNGPQEGHVYIAIQDAFDKQGGTTAVGNFVNQIVDGTANFVGQIALKAVGPEGVGKYVAAYQAAFKDIYGNAKFDIAAGSPEDLQKDVENFFKQVLPTMAMRAAFGQIGYDPSGNRDATGGVGGLDWNLNNSQYMDASGNWIKKQLYDPNAPIPLMLTGLGFSADKINEIALKLANGTDITAFEKYLNDLVGVVVDLGTLATEFGRTTKQWFDFIHQTQAEKGTAAEFSPAIANLKAQGSLLDTIFGDDRVTAAKQLVTDSGTLLNNMAQALAGILSMIDSIKTTTAATVQSYQNKLLTPAEIETQARLRSATDVGAISTGKNPDEVMAAWKAAMTDFATVLDAIVARINAIKTLQQSYADFRTQMATNAGPQFATDPGAWLAQNQKDIDAATTALKTATGDDAIKNAQTLLTLTEARYNNEVAQLAKINGLIQSITETGQQTSDNLKMQGMGHVVNGQWVPDTHAQGDYLKSQYDDLMKQLGAATTPEDVQKIYGKLQSVISQLAAQPQDPNNYAESRSILSGMNDAATKAATDLLKKWGKSLDSDLSGTGDKLKAGEDALAKALAAAQKDFTTELTLMTDASDVATKALTTFADGLTTAMNDLVKAINHWIWVMTHPDGTPDPNGPQVAPGQGPGATPDKNTNWVDDPDDPTYQINTVTGRRRKKPAPGPVTGDVPTPSSVTAGGTTKPGTTVNVAVTVNSGSPEEIAAAAAEAVQAQVLAAIRNNNVELVRVIRNNPSLIATAS